MQVGRGGKARGGEAAEARRGGGGRGAQKRLPELEEGCCRTRCASTGRARRAQLVRRHAAAPRAVQGRAAAPRRRVAQRAERLAVRRVLPARPPRQERDAAGAADALRPRLPQVGDHVALGLHARRVPPRGRLPRRCAQRPARVPRRLRPAAVVKGGVLRRRRHAAALHAAGHRVQRPRRLPAPEGIVLLRRRLRQLFRKRPRVAPRAGGAPLLRALWRALWAQFGELGAILSRSHTPRAALLSSCRSRCLPTARWRRAASTAKRTTVSSCDGWGRSAPTRCTPTCRPTGRTRRAASRRRGSRSSGAAAGTTRCGCATAIRSSCGSKLRCRG